MSKTVAVQPAKDEVEAPEVATPVADAALPATDAAVPVAAETAVSPAKAGKKSVSGKRATAPKTAVKPGKKIPAAKEKVADAPKAEKAAKVKKQTPKKPKLVRDSFTIPEGDYVLFASLKQRALSAGVEVNKSEILRAAMATLAKLDDVELVEAIGLVERIKTGRPKK